MVLESVSDVEVDRCPGCQALWFDAAELDRFAAAHAQAPPGEAALPDRGIGGHACPRCWPQPMDFVGWSGMLLDRCDSCGGLFVEAGELRRLMAGERAPMNVEAWLASELTRMGWRLMYAKSAAYLVLRVLIEVRR